MSAAPTASLSSGASASEIVLEDFAKSRAALAAPHSHAPNKTQAQVEAHQAAGGVLADHLVRPEIFDVEALPFTLVHDDAHFCVLDKPHDLRMDGLFSATAEKLMRSRQPLPGGGKHHHCHQIDYATSGCLLYAKDAQACAAACWLFESRQVFKSYLALVRGHLREMPAGVAGVSAGPAAHEMEVGGGGGGLPPSKRQRAPDAPSGAATEAAPADAHSEEPPASETSGSGGRFRIDRPIGDVGGESWFMRIAAAEDEAAGAHPAGRAAVTNVTILAHGTLGGRAVTKVLLQPISGRRHQLRLHMAHAGAPIVGDVSYGGAEEAGASRMCLHSWTLTANLPWLVPGSTVPRRSHKGVRAWLAGKHAAGSPVEVLAAVSGDPFVVGAPLMGGLQLEAVA